MHFSVSFAHNSEVIYETSEVNLIHPIHILSHPDICRRQQLSFPPLSGRKRTQRQYGHLLRAGQERIYLDRDTRRPEPLRRIYVQSVP